MKTEYFVVYNEMFYDCLLFWDDACKRFQVSIKSQAFIRTVFQIENEFFFQTQTLSEHIVSKLKHDVFISFSWKSFVIITIRLASFFVSFSV